MQVILSFVTSLDGSVTDAAGRPPAAWASKEDQKHFFSLMKRCRVVILGRRTYAAQKGEMRLSPDILRIVVTKNPQTYRKEAVPGQLEFTSLSPRALMRALEKRGYTSVLLAAGPRLARQFIQAMLVDELHLTVEPILFGDGMKLDLGHARLTLISRKTLNDEGTLLLCYRLVPLRSHSGGR